MDPRGGGIPVPMPTHGDAFRFLEESWAPAVGPVGPLLYVGHRADTSPWWATRLRDLLGGPALAVLDVDPGNLATASGLTGDLLLGDVRDPGALRGRRFGLVVWDEGPEHVPRADALACLTRLMADHGAVLVSCPWGHQPQGRGPEDIEFHHWGPDPADLEGIGMSARAFGTRFDGAGRGHGNLLGWWPALPGLTSTGG